MKIKNITELYDILPENEMVIVDILRHLVKTHLPKHGKEKISYNVPYFYGNKGICIIWPASIPRGGIREGVLLGFWQGNKLEDKYNYLTHGTNKKIFYKIYQSVDEIDVDNVVSLLKEAAQMDSEF